MTVLHEDEIASWLARRADGEVADRPVGAGRGTAGRRRRLAAGDRRAAGGAWRRVAPQLAWAQLGAERLIAQLPAGAVHDVPEQLARLLRDEPTLAETLAVFLDAAGDVKATATALSLHRSGLYYRLRRIEELTGLRLDDGDDRLLAHLAVRLTELR